MLVEHHRRRGALELRWYIDGRPLDRFLDVDFLLDEVPAERGWRARLR